MTSLPTAAPTAETMLAATHRPAHDAPPQPPGLPTALLIVDGKGQIVSINRAVTLINGYAPDEAIGQPVGQLFACDNGLLAAALGQLENADSWQGRLRGQRKNGEAFWLHATMIAVRAPGGHLVQRLIIYSPLDHSLPHPARRIGDKLLQAVIPERDAAALPH